jgi:hypothetical protein
MSRSRGWDGTYLIRQYWRSALVFCFNYGVDTGTVRKFPPAHEPILWRQLLWGRQSSDREANSPGALKSSGSGTIPSPGGSLAAVRINRHAWTRIPIVVRLARIRD